MEKNEIAMSQLIRLFTAFESRKTSDPWTSGLTLSPRTPKKLSSPSTDDGEEEEEERRARIDGTLDEVVEASSSVVAGSRIPRLRRRQLVSGGELIDGPAHPRLESKLLRRELTPHPRRHPLDFRRQFDRWIGAQRAAC